jgi:hypothetical protein
MFVNNHLLQQLPTVPRYQPNLLTSNPLCTSTQVLLELLGDFLGCSSAFSSDGDTIADSALASDDWRKLLRNCLLTVARVLLLGLVLLFAVYLARALQDNLPGPFSMLRHLTGGR